MNGIQNETHKKCVWRITYILQNIFPFLSINKRPICINALTSWNPTGTQPPPPIKKNLKVIVLRVNHAHFNLGQNFQRRCLECEFYRCFPLVWPHIVNIYNFYIILDYCQVLHQNNEMTFVSLILYIACFRFN